MGILLENYEDSYAAVAHFGNENCTLEFAPESSHTDDLPYPFISLFKGQKTGQYLRSQVVQVQMSSFVDSVLKQNTLMPLSVRELPVAKMTELVKLCQAVSEITAIFGSVNKISHTYRDKSGYVVKRLYQLSQDEKLFKEEGFSGESRIYTPTYAGKPW